MFCKNCGTPVDDSTKYCPTCGTPLSQPITDSSVNEDCINQNFAPTEAIKKQKGSKKGLKIIGIILAAIMMFFIALMLIPSSEDEDDYIQIVKNGYLGEYTDFTVQELLDGYYEDVMGYEAKWDGGINKDGENIVEVKYTDSSIDDTIIQFTMLDEQVFRVTAYIDPMFEIEKPTDLYAELNYIYLMSYVVENESKVGDMNFEQSFIDRLDKIHGSAVVYGASAEYEGDRAKLYELFDDEPLEVTVPWLLDTYGYLDMSYYFTSDEAETQVITEEQTENTTPVADDYIFPSDSRYITQADMSSWDSHKAWLARNEIFARHGYIFQNEELQNYFLAKSWYEPNSSYSESMLNEIEKANVATIKAFEDANNPSDSTPTANELIENAISIYMSSQGEYNWSIDYTEDQGGGTYWVCVTNNDYGWEALYVVKVDSGTAKVVGINDGGTYVPV